MDEVTFGTLWVRKIRRDKHPGSPYTAREMQDYCDVIDQLSAPFSARSVREKSKNGIVVVALGDYCDEWTLCELLTKHGYQVIDKGKITTDLILTIEALQARPYP